MSPYKDLIKKIDDVRYKLIQLEDSYTERRYYNTNEDDPWYHEYENKEKKELVANEEKLLNDELDKLTNELGSLKLSLDKKLADEIETKKTALEILKKEIQNKNNNINELELTNKQLVKDLFIEEGFNEVVKYLNDNKDFPFTLDDNPDNLSCVLTEDEKDHTPVINFCFDISDTYDAGEYDYDSFVDFDEDDYSVNDEYFAELFSDKVEYENFTNLIEDKFPEFYLEADDFGAEVDDVSVEWGGSGATQWEPADYWVEVSGEVPVSATLYICKKIPPIDFDINDID